MRDFQTDFKFVFKLEFCCWD